MILILSERRDVHAAAVMKILAEREVPATLLDLSKFPQSLALTVGFPKNTQRRMLLQGTELGEVDLIQCGAAWWRRPQPFGLPPAMTRPSHRVFAYNETGEAFAGLWQLLNVFWVNHPVRTEVAGRKLYQLRVAQEVALEIPETLVSSDPQEVRRFVGARGADGVIYKTFSATQDVWRETRLLRENEIPLLDNVCYAPVIFQEYVAATYDLRITVVGDKVFPAAIYSQETAYKVDFRMDMANARIEAVELPADVTARLLAFMAKLDLAYGAIDMRLTPDGRYVFLEVNPAGQWLFVENASGQPIAQTLAELLIAEDRKRQPH